MHANLWKRLRFKPLYAALLSTALLGAAGPVQAYSGEELAKDAAVSLSAARDIALKARPGTVTDEELEEESGGSGLRYTFDIKIGAVTYEVGVDARTGDVLENSSEGSNPD